MQLKDSTITATAIAGMMLVLGFAYGDLAGRQYGFQLEKWQTLTGTLVAVVAASLAYLGVRSTQRINIMLREEDRIERALPGLWQTRDLLSLILDNASALRAETQYLSHELIRSVVRPQDGETYEALARRLVPLADGELQRDLRAVIFRLMTQAQMLKVMKDEVDRTQADLAAIDTFAASSHQAVRDQAERVEKASERETATYLSILKTAERLRDALSERIKQGEDRRKVIREVIRKYFHGQ